MRGKYQDISEKKQWIAVVHLQSSVKLRGLRLLFTSIKEIIMSVGIIYLSEHLYKIASKEKNKSSPLMRR